MNSQLTLNKKQKKLWLNDKFDDEIVPVPVKVKKQIVEFKVDEGPRPGTTVETLGKITLLLW